MTIVAMPIKDANHLERLGTTGKGVMRCDGTNQKNLGNVTMNAAFSDRLYIPWRRANNIMKSCFYWFATIFSRLIIRLYHGSTITILIIPVNEVLGFPPFSQTSTNPNIKQLKTDHLHNQLVTFQIKHPGDSGHLPVVRQLGQQKVVLKGWSWNLVTLVAWGFKPTMLKSPGSPKV